MSDFLPDILSKSICCELIILPSILFDRTGAEGGNTIVTVPLSERADSHPSTTVVKPFDSTTISFTLHIFINGYKYFYTTST